jgi:hypothetical protein
MKPAAAFRHAEMSVSACIAIRPPREFVEEMLTARTRRNSCVQLLQVQFPRRNPCMFGYSANEMIGQTSVAV